jgi:hypothetical protein
MLGAQLGGSMRFTVMQRVARFQEERKALEDLRKAVRKTIKKWKKAHKGPVGQKVSAKFYKRIKFIW